MGFLRKMLGYNSSSSSYNPKTYTTNIGSPNVTTDTTVSAEEAPKKAEEADTKDYDETEVRRKKKNGVKGTFTNPAMDTSGTVAQVDSVGA